MHTFENEPSIENRIQVQFDLNILNRNLCNFTKKVKKVVISRINETENSWVLYSCARFCVFVNLSLYKTYALHTNAICQKFKPEFYRLSTNYLNKYINCVML